jgi:hypothetical protein
MIEQNAGLFVIASESALFLLTGTFTVIDEVHGGLTTHIRILDRLGYPSDVSEISLPLGLYRPRAELC